MKLTKKLEAELMQVYETWWNSYLTGDVETYHSFLDDDYHFVGSTNGEEYLNRKDTTAFFEKTADQLAGKAELRNTKRTIEELDGGLILITDLADAFVISEPEWVFYSRFRFTSLLRNTQNGWRFIYQHFSAPDTKAQEGETLGTEQITKENQELRDAIKRRTNELEIKNRELAIEAALERVRSKAMSMRKPDDLLTISKIVFTGLQSLGFNALRNALIHSYVDKENYFIDYDYSDFTGGVLSKIPYTGSPVIEKFISDIRKSRDAFSAIEISGSQLIEWKAFRLANNENIDPRLENIDALYYYFYSVGACSIGISTYKAISPEDLKLLERFRNVFNLSYQRYADIAKAEEQAREAKIEAALERIRSKSLAMYKTDDLSGVVSVLFEQMQGLSIDMGFASVSIFIFEEGSRNMNQWIQLPDGVASLRVPYFEHPISSDLFGAKERGAEYFSKVYSVEEKNTWAEKGFELTDYKNLPEEFKTSLLESPGYAISITLARNSGICIPSFVGSFPSAEDVEIMKRAGKVFEQAYTRFLDLQKAEAQAREAKIETALERVRSRSLAMHKSDELNEVVSILFEKLKELQIPATAVGIAIYIDGSKDLNAFVCGENEAGLVITNYRLPYFNNKISKDLSNALEKQLDFFVGNYSKEEKNSFYKYVLEHTAEFKHLPEDIKRMIFESPSYTITMVAVKNAVFNINDFEGKVLSDNEVDIIKRFARVFDQAYTRFLDLQNAEAQTREAQIEIAVERIRAKALAMHKSEEILNVAVSLREEMVKLNLQGVVAATIFLEQANGNYRLWDLTEMTDIEDGARLSLDIDFNPDTIDSDLFFLKFLRSTEKYLIVETNKADFERWAAWYRHYDAAGADKFLQYLQTTSITQSWHAAVPLEKGRLKVDFTNPPPKEMEIILPKMAAAFDLAYTRFLDIQKAEAQAREAQIETAVERVRAQSMAMYKTSDLYKVNEEILSQLNKLKVDGLTGVSIYLVDENDVVKVWDLSSPGNISNPSNYTIKYDAKKYPILGGWVETWKTSNQDYFVLDFPKEVLIRAVEEFKEILPEMAVHIKNAIESGKLQHQWNPSGRLSDGLLSIDLIIPPTEDTKSIVTKMAGAFNLAYQRFQDLQKAEAQAREAQIELGLERVRARAMAMQKSDELAELVDTVFKELTKLDFALSWCMINIVDEPSLSNTVWGVNPEIGKAPESYHMLFEDFRFHHEMFKAWKEKKAKWRFVLKGNEKEIYDEYLFNQTEFRRVPEPVQKQMRATKQYEGSFTFSNFGGLQTIGEEPLSEANMDILARFGKVFDLTYTRFNDLQKAEASAREAEIELALERVRSQAMAMQESSELLDIVVTMRNEFTRLGHEAHYFWHMMWLHEKYEKAMTSGDGSKIGMVMELPRHIHGDIKLLADWEKSKEPTVVYAMDAEAAVDYVDKMINLGDFKQVDPNAPSHDDIRHIGGLTFIMARTTHGEIGFSLPGVVKNPPKEDLDILVRFAGAFDIAHRRFLDLKKSEAQAREVQIELALEKVRSRSMGMQKSEELKEVIQVVFDEFVQLNIHIEHTGFIIDYKANDDMHIWLADHHEVPTEVTLPYFDCAHWNSFIDAKEKGKDFFANHLEYEEKNKFYRDLFELIPGVPEEALEYYLRAPGLAISTVLLNNVGLYIENFTGTPYTEDENIILMRFGKVFQQTYTRFLDLKKAEAQAREAQIQLALERVRARTMAMQHSDELGEASALLFKQISDLGIQTWTSGFNIWEKGDTSFIGYNPTPTGGIAGSYHIPSTEDPFFINIYEAKKREEDFFVFESAGESLANTYHYMKTLPIIKDVLKGIEDSGFPMPTCQINHCAFFNHGFLLFITLEPSPNAHDIFKRFGKVFKQTYTRFLDLQKAEAQAREAKIEAALEKVRSRSLAMHNADELGEVVAVIIEKLNELGVVLDANGVILCTYFPDSKDVLHWMASPDFSFGGSYLLPYFNHPIFNDAWNSKEAGDEYFSKDYTVEEKNSFFKYAFEHSDYKSFPEEFKHWIFQNDKHVLSFAWQKNSAILIPSHTGITPSESEQQILIRFAKVFEQAYTRFLDLQKAEAQAREAKIEYALEKVRSRTMAMQKSEELHETSQILFQQMKELGEPVEQLTIGIVKETENVVEVFATVQGSQLQQSFRHSIDEPTVMNKIYRGWKAQQKSLLVEMNSDEIQVYNRYRNELVKSEMFSTTLSKDDRRILYAAYFSKGMLALGSNTPLSEESHRLLERFAGVFDGTYTRFLDLQKAEAQSREAQIELGLERVRARAMAMQTSEELKELIGTVFTELTKLDLIMIGSVIIIFDPETNSSRWWMVNSNAPSEPLSFFIKYHEHTPYQEFIQAWQERKLRWEYELHGSTKKEWDEFLFTQTELDSVPAPVIVGMKTPERILLSTSFNNFGCLNVGTLNPLTEEQFDILLRFAKVFDLTYTRFNDLQKVEAQAREAQIEAALERIRSSAMAMHSSEGILEVTHVLREQIALLGEKELESILVHIYYEDKDQFEAWYSYRHPESSNVEIVNGKQILDWSKTERARKDKEKYHEKESDYTIVANRKMLKEWYEYLYKLVPEVVELNNKGEILVPEVLYYNYSKISGGALLLITNNEPSQESKYLLKRAAKVFNLAYSRFLDLQKAEAQARDARIEMALEKIRSRTMAMQHSDELPEAANLLFLEVQALGIPAWSCGYNILSADKKSSVCIMSSEGEIQIPFTLPLTEHSSFLPWYEAIQKELPFAVYEMGGEELVDHYKYMGTLPELEQVFKQFDEAGISLPTHQINHLCRFTNGFLLFITYEPVPHAHDIFKRFTKVFEQTYTRFLDLKKAEARARESQIEASLEKVRSRTMGMQKSDELGNVATILFKELNLLVDNLWTCGFVLCEKDRDEDEWWLSDENGFIPPFYLPNTGDVTHANIYNAWRNGENYHTEQLEGKELKEHYDWLMNLPVARKIFDDMLAGGFKLPTWQKLHCAFFKTGYLVIITQVPCAEEEIFKRFAQAFDLTYTRFLDLKKSEAQTRQAQIEVALERVRARALAMQQPEELKEVAEVLRQEMGLLGVEELETCSIYINDENAEKAECWYALKDLRSDEKKLVNDHFALNLNDTWVGREMLSFYNSSAKQISIVMAGANRVEWIRYCEANSAPFLGYYGEEIPDRMYHLYKFSHGAIGAASAGDISAESWSLLKRTASVFSLAYSRFKDLTQARIDLQRLKEEKQRAEDALTNLQAAQKQLVQSEKMASLGELTAGIAHEIQNPLNFVNNFSEVSKELLDELKEELEKGNLEDAKEIMKDVIQNLEKINHHGKRADGIVKGMLQHSQSSTGKKEPTDINALCDEYLRLSYHGLRAKDKSFNATLITDFDNSLSADEAGIGNINVIPQDIGRVILNLINNAFYAVNEKQKQNLPGYEPTVTIKTSQNPPSGGRGAEVFISVSDNGPGIPQKVLDKIFQPFFTTKPTGQGTGLGLSLSYDIVKAHGGDITVNSKDGEGSEFTIKLPIT